MSNLYKTFDAALDTLHRGVNVVEASAGTGKTYAIAMLVLRFVVEHDNLPVQEILVVSYTRAATEELRSRIRQRLFDARELLSGRSALHEDEGLSHYVATLPDAKLALRRLNVAILDMDKAAVFTIHGFCQRMLQEQALESGQLFDMELTADVTGVQNELVFDYWRTELYKLSSLHCSLFLGRFSAPEALYNSVKNVAVEDIIEPGGRISKEQALKDVDSALEALVVWWQKESSELEHCFLGALDKGMFKKAFAGNFHSWWKQCSSFFSGQCQHLPQNLSWLGKQGLMDVLNGTKLRGDAKKDAFLQEFPLAGTVLETFLAACDVAVLALRIHLALELQTGLRQRLFEQGRFSFDDLVLSLANALHSSRKNELKTILSARFQVALIDEFQDTDAAQYRIFSTLFGGEEKKHFLYLIGDPKQAIYKFRGADIYAYFQARKSADLLLGLEKNYRSNACLVEAVNALFIKEKAERDVFVNKDLPYVEVVAAKTSEDMQLQQDGQSLSAMVYCSVQSPDENGVKTWTGGKCRKRIQSYIVHEIQELLTKNVSLVEEDETRDVQAGDIAILVRTNKQAEEFQHLLSLVSIPSVVSSRKTVFETQECLDLQQVLRAVAMPSDVALLRTALSCKWFGMNGQELYGQIQDPEKMDQWMLRFHEYRHLWQEKGLLATMNTLFAREAVFEALCMLPLVERSITNLMHLTEIVQEVESAENLSPHGVLQYLATEMESCEAGEHAELRLESDEDAVKIVTMHAVKGLEYPIVFCPYLWHRSGWLMNEKNCISFHNESGVQVADLGSTNFESRRVEALQEEMAEEIRLLYVAVTRASSRCYTFWADVGGGKNVAPSRKSALAWVLGLDRCGDILEQTEQIEELCHDDSVELRYVLPQENEQTQTVAGLNAAEELSCRTFTGFPLPNEWLMTSYSALAGSGHSSFSQAVQSTETIPESRQKIYELPFGAAFGNVVHGLLEEYPFANLAGSGYEEECQAQCRRFGVVAGSAELINLVRDVVSSPLTGDGETSFSLADLDENDVLKEMPFYFHLREGSTGQVNSLLKFSNVVQPIQDRQLKGYLTGFIDLVCRHQGKYYILDYKTNYLGDYVDNYDNKSLVAAMHDHNYGLQYWIYTVVLHRFLQQSLPEYDYERDFGGVFYLFARGMRPESSGNGVYFSCPDKNVLNGLYDCLGAK